MSPGTTARSPGSRAWLFLAIAIVAEVIATLSLKGALTHPVLIAVIVAGYLVAFTFLSLTLRAGVPLGVAYGTWGAVGVALTAVLSWLVFGEALTPLMMAGIALVIAGVVCIELGSHHAAGAPAAHEPGPDTATGGIPVVEVAEALWADTPDERADGEARR